jgi:hypothetical protein
MKVYFGVWRWIGAGLTAWLAELLYVASGGQFPDPDLWGRLSMGALITRTGRFPYHDIFSYTAPGALWIDHEWLTGLLLYKVLQLFGEAGFVAFYALLVLGIFITLFLLHGKLYKVSPCWALYGLFATIGVSSIGFYSTLRSHTFSFLFFGLFLLALETARLTPNRWRCLLWLIPLGTLWGNMHGGLAMGLVLLACYSLSAAITTKRWQAVLPFTGTGFGILGALALFNPYGPRYLDFLWYAWTLDRHHIGEWSPLKLYRWDYLPGQVLLMLTLCLFLLHILSWLRRHPQRLHSERFALLAPCLTLLAISGLSLKAVRLQPFLALAMVGYAPLILPSLISSIKTIGTQWLPPSVRGESFLRFQKTLGNVFTTTLPCLVAMGSLTGLLYLNATLDLTRLRLCDELTIGDNRPPRYPLGMVEALQRSPLHGNLMVRFGLGEFAYWALYPQFRISMDGRYEEVYSQAQFLHNQFFYDKKEPARAQASVATLAQDPTDYILTEPDLPSTAVLLNTPQWHLLGGNEYFLLFVNRKRVRGLPDSFRLSLSLPLQTKSIRNFFPPKNWILKN